MTFSSINPATGKAVWTGDASDAAAVDEAVARARVAFDVWRKRPIAERDGVLRAFAGVLTERKAALANLISEEVGKPRWEALTEVQTMIGKIALSIDAHARRCGEFKGGPAVTRFRPHGVVAVFGPYNFPGHLPNGHIAPALLAGNAVLFKPSEFAPAVAEFTRECWRAAGLPEDALIVVQGGADTGRLIVEHRGVDGIFFTGGTRAGRAIAAASLAFPNRILALEMGGNNPLVVWPPHDPDAAATLVVQSAFISAGQRCTCARRLILQQGPKGDVVLEKVVALAAGLRVGVPSIDPEPFMGPLVSARAASQVIGFEADLVRRGASVLLGSRQVGPALVTPSIVDVTGIEREDEEVFGPLLQVVRVPDFESAIVECNRTRFGLAAGLVGGGADLYSKFNDSVRAGVINWNQSLTGASGAAPFGGVGESGNHRPSGFFAADYCSYPVASIEVDTPQLPKDPLPGFGVSVKRGGAA